MRLTNVEMTLVVCPDREKSWYSVVCLYVLCKYNTNIIKREKVYFFSSKTTRYMDFGYFFHCQSLPIIWRMVMLIGTDL